MFSQNYSHVKWNSHVAHNHKKIVGTTIQNFENITKSTALNKIEVPLDVLLKKTFVSRTYNIPFKFTDKIEFKTSFSSAPCDGTILERF